MNIDERAEHIKQGLRLMAWRARIRIDQILGTGVDHLQATPRVDRNTFKVGKDEVVYASFARCLERECNTRYYDQWEMRGTIAGMRRGLR